GDAGRRGGCGDLDRELHLAALETVSREVRTGREVIGVGGAGGQLGPPLGAGEVLAHGVAVGGQVAGRGGRLGGLGRAGRGRAGRSGGGRVAATGRGGRDAADRAEREQHQDGVPHAVALARRGRGLVGAGLGGGGVGHGDSLFNGEPGNRQRAVAQAARTPSGVSPSGNTAARRLWLRWLLV